MRHQGHVAATDYQALAANRAYFGDFDPFGDFDLLFGAAKLGLEIVDLPIRYRERTYGSTNIQRWRHGWLLLKMCCSPRAASSSSDVGTTGLDVVAMRTDRGETAVPRRQASWSWTEALVVLFMQLALVGLIYRHTLQLAFLSDAWVYLGHLRDGVWTTITTAIGYHYQPVACAWVALIRGLFGERAAAFQAVNLGEVGMLGFLTYALGGRLLADNVSAFLGSLLLVGNAAFYEIAYWPLAGNMQLSRGAALRNRCDPRVRVSRGHLGRTGPWLLAVTVLAAIFTHPATTTAVPVCALTMLLVGDSAGDSLGLGNTRTQKLRALVLLAAVAVLFGLTRLAFTAEFSAGPQPGFDRMRLYWLVSRGIVAVFSLEDRTK